MNTKYIILVAVTWAGICNVLAGSAPPAHQAPVARQASVAPVHSTFAGAPAARVAPTAPRGPQAPVAPTSRVSSAPIAPVAPTPAQGVNSNFSNAYTSRDFTNGIPTAYFKNTNSVYWATNPPYGNPLSGYTNRTMPLMVRPARPATNKNNFAPSPQQ
ncbi:MAG: hypothetical protein ACREFR_18710 [Limisphaerales bacterium]